MRNDKRNIKMYCEYTGYSKRIVPYITIYLLVVKMNLTSKHLIFQDIGSLTIVYLFLAVTQARTWLSKGRVFHEEFTGICDITELPVLPTYFYFQVKLSDLKSHVFKCSHCAFVKVSHGKELARENKREAKRGMENAQLDPCPFV